MNVSHGLLDAVNGFSIASSTIVSIVFKMGINTFC